MSSVALKVVAVLPLFGVDRMVLRTAFCDWLLFALEAPLHENPIKRIITCPGLQCLPCRIQGATGEFNVAMSPKMQQLVWTTLLSHRCFFGFNSDMKAWWTLTSMPFFNSADWMASEMKKSIPEPEHADPMLISAGREFSPRRHMISTARSATA
jgi:hypothetical protein